MSPLDPKPPVEPLGEAQWERIERRLFDARDRERTQPSRDDARGRRRSRVALAFGLGALSAAGAAVAITLLVMGRGGDSRPARVAMVPRVVTTDAAGSRIVLDGAVIELAPRTTAEIAPGEAGAVTVSLEVGKVSCEVTPRAGRPPFVVVAGDVVVEVVGTVFAVERDPDVTVSVTRGKVKVASGGGTAIAVAAGEEWNAKAGVKLAGLGDDRRQATGDRQQATGQEPAPAAGRRPPVGRWKTGNGTADATGVVAGSAVDLAGEDAVAKLGEPRRAAELRTARRLKWAESPEAQPRLEKLAVGSDKYAAAALYELAHLWLFRKRVPEKTIAISIDYEQRFPHGKDASEVLWLRIEAYVDKDERVSARAAAELYLARYPNGDKRERAGEVLGR